MGHSVDASTLIQAALRELGLPAEAADRLFDSAPRDFAVRFSASLPFQADRRRMLGITICGHVWLVDSLLTRSPSVLLVLLRHEAEHVRQQREYPFTFYPRYLLGWLRGVVLRRLDSEEAYRSIRFEREAYAAGDVARAKIDSWIGGVQPATGRSD